jgi:hypothetical protein
MSYIKNINPVMMKKLVFLLLILLSFMELDAKKTAEISFTSCKLVIDGSIEDYWASSITIEKINVFFKSEVPTIGNSTWQALFDDENFYCCIFVDDDTHYPSWKAGSTETWTYDKPEVYWDVNTVLNDGVGAGTSNSGHYQFAPGFLEDSYDTEITVAQTAAGNQNPGGTYAYSLIGEGYVYEIAVPWSNMPDKDGNPNAFINFKQNGIGFDITIIDQDEGITTSRQRANWNNVGAIDECWNNMDDAGVIQAFVCCDPPVGDGISSVKLPSLNITPNPVCDHFNILGEVDHVEIYTILGKMLRKASIKNNRVEAETLLPGAYLIKAYRNGKYQGSGKIIKN